MSKKATKKVIENEVADVENTDVENTDVLKNIVLSGLNNPFDISFKTDNENSVIIVLDKLQTEHYKKLEDKNNMISFKTNPIYYLNSLNTKINNNGLVKCIESIDINIKTKTITFNIANFEENMNLFVDALVKTNKSIKGVFERDLAKVEGRLGSGTRTTKKEPLFNIE